MNASPIEPFRKLSFYRGVLPLALVVGIFLLIYLSDLSSWRIFTLELIKAVAIVVAVFALRKAVRRTGDLTGVCMRIADYGVSFLLLVNMLGDSALLGFIFQQYGSKRIAQVNSLLTMCRGLLKG